MEYGIRIASNGIQWYVIEDPENSDKICKVYYNKNDAQKYVDSHKHSTRLKKT